MWEITEESLEAIALGTGILGTGGGFNPYIGLLRAREIIRKYGPVKVLLPEELTDNDKVVCVGGIGAPTVDIEKIRGTDSYTALRAMEDQTNTKATALISGEIGGGNSIEPIIAGAMANLPIVDADGNVVPNSVNKVTFTITKGPGKVIGTHNGDPACKN